MVILLVFGFWLYSTHASSYPSTVISLPQYCTASCLLILALHCSEQPLLNWFYPSIVNKNIHCTAQTLLRVVVKWGKYSIIKIFKIYTCSLIEIPPLHRCKCDIWKSVFDVFKKSGHLTVFASSAWHQYLHKKHMEISNNESHISKDFKSNPLVKRRYVCIVRLCYDYRK